MVVEFNTIESAVMDIAPGRYYFKFKYKSSWVVDSIIFLIIYFNKFTYIIS